MWYYKGSQIKSIEDVPESAIGFIYKITNNTTGKFYIGKKSLYSNRKKTISDREKKKLGMINSDGSATSAKRVKRVVKESNWFKYYGSSADLKADITELGKEQFHREILEFCCTKKYMTFSEMAHQIKEDVLTKESYNGNIMGRYYRKDMENC
jgi:hypothetical protein